MSMSICVIVVAAAAGFSVVSPEAPAAWERTAAEEVSNYLARASSGGKVSVDGREGAVFHVGDTALARERGMLSSAFKDEEWAVRSFGRDVVINGGGTRGCLYAAYHFLEDALGVRFWSEQEEDVPGPGDVSLGAIDMRGKPYFMYRDIFRSTNPGKSTSRLAIRRRLNRNGDVFVPMELGGAWQYGPPSHVHSFSIYLPWSKYGKEHPEYFALRNGIREGGSGTQICVSNPELRGLFLRELREYIAKGEARAKERGVPAPTLYDVSMNDTPNLCQCEECKKLSDRYGVTGMYFDFYNYIAREMAKEHPEIMLSTLAYYFTEEVPKGGIVPADNMIVRLCDTRSNQAASIYEPGNDVFLKLLEAWQPITKNLFVWDYAAIFAKTTHSFPFPSEFYYGDQYSAYARHGVKGIFLEHEYQDIGDLWDIKYYIETRLMENPFEDNAALLAKAMSEYFGPAAPMVSRARAHLDRIRKERKAFIGWTPELGEFDFIHADDIAEMQKAYAEAEKAVGGDERFVRRVRRARLGIDDMQKLISSFESFRSGDGWRFDPDGLDIVGKKAPIRRVDDPESPSGKAIVLDVDASVQRYYDLPFVIGLRDQAERNTVRQQFYRKPPAEKGYGVYALEDVSFPRDSFLFFCRSWQVQRQTGYPQLTAGSRRYDVKLHVKMAGPRFFPGSADKNEVYIGRLEILPHEGSR